MQIDMKRVDHECNMDRFYLSNSHKVCLWIRMPPFGPGRWYHLMEVYYLVIFNLLLIKLILFQIYIYIRLALRVFEPCKILKLVKHID